MKNYITPDFEKILEKSSFKYKIRYFHEKNKIKKTKMIMPICESCFDKTFKENLKDKNFLNKYEIHNMS